MEARPIRTENDYNEALSEFERYFDKEPERGSPEADRFELLGILLQDYETRRWPIAPADPVSILHFAIRDMGRTQADLARILGSRSRASEILNKRRALTLEMIQKISAEWRIPIAALARSYDLERTPARSKKLRRPRSRASKQKTAA